MKEGRGVQDPAPSSSQISTSRLIFGGCVLVFGFCTPAFIPLVTNSSLPVGWKTALSGLLAFGVPELFMVVAASIMGKDGFAFLKGKMFAFLKKAAPPDEVGLTRYRVGLFFFSFPLLIAWLLPYFQGQIPNFQSYSLIVQVAGDIMMLLGLILLGGNFWDKLRGLFIHKAVIKIPEK